MLRHFFLILLVFPALANETILNQDPNPSIHQSLIGPGVVVEWVAPRSPAEKAGVIAGDVLLKWTRDSYTGEFQSTFDLMAADIEQANRGKVVLEGRRGGEKRSWVLTWGSWAIEARPNFSGPLLADYFEAKTMSGKRDAGSGLASAQRWKELAAKYAAAEAPWLKLWLLMRSAEVLRDKQRWKEEEEEYEALLKSAAGSGAFIEAELLRFAAYVYRDGGDMPNGQKYMRRSIATLERAGGHEMALALSVNDLGMLVGEAGDAAGAEKLFRRALEIYEKNAPGSITVASSLGNVGAALMQLRNLPGAEQYLRRSMAMHERIAPESENHAVSLINLGTVELALDDLPKAEANLLHAFKIQEKLDRGGYRSAITLGNLGDIAYRSGELAKAEDFHLKALAIKEKLVPGSPSLIYTYNGLGKIAEQRGELAAAERYFRQALEICEQKTPESLDTSETLNNLAALTKARGDMARAEQLLLRALAMLEKTAPESLDAAVVLGNLGSIANSRGDMAGAERYYRRALANQRKLSPKGLDTAVSLLSLGALAQDRGDLATAGKYFRRALAMQREAAPRSLDIGLSLNALGSLENDRERPAAAERYYRQAAALYEKVAPESLEMAVSLQRLGEVAGKSQGSAKARTLFEHALAIREKLAPGSKDHAESLAALGSVMRDLGQTAAAERLYAQAVSALEHQSARLGGSEEVRAGFRESQSKIYRDYIDLLLAQKRTERAFEALEQSRGHVLLEMLAAAHIDVRTGADPALLERERAVQAGLAAKSGRRLRLLGKKGKEKELEALTQQIAGLKKQYEEIEGQLRLNSPNYAALTQPAPLILAQIQRLLDPDTVLLEYSLGEKRSHVFVVTPEAVAVYELPRRAVIERAAKAAYRLLSSRGVLTGVAQEGSHGPSETSSWEQACKTLGRLVLSPVAAAIRGKRLLVVGDGALQYIPFAVLPSPELSPGRRVTLISEHEIVNLPSASILAVLRRESSARAPAGNRIAVLADPVFDFKDGRLRGSAFAGGDPNRRSHAPGRGVLDRSARETGAARNGLFPRLFYSRREADAISSMAGAGDAIVKLDFDASKTAALAMAPGRYRIVHLATHGLLNSEHPELSGLVFSLFDRNGKEQDGFLGLTDIYNLELKADIVVLSACQTALGRQINGEGLIGITRGFMYAGSPRVVASLWNVDDQATAYFMSRFYEGILKKGQTPAAALRAAQTWMLQQPRWRAPYYWAGFILQGEWK